MSATVLNRIGVLGGMGPQATILLQQRLVAGVDASDDASHVPLLIDMNPQVPSRLDWLLKREGQDPGPVLAGMAKRLENAGATALAMPCNTAHHFAPAIVSAVGIPLLDMVDLSAQALVRSVGTGARVGILASPATQRTNLFGNALGRHALEVVFPERMDALLATIRRIKSAGTTERDVDALSAAGNDCRERGAACLLVGCSEFSLLTGRIDSDLPVIDTLDVLVSEMLAVAGATPG